MRQKEKKGKRGERGKNGNARKMLAMPLKIIVMSKEVVSLSMVSLWWYIDNYDTRILIVLVEVM
jgi:hypothetical protein